MTPKPIYKHSRVILGDIIGGQDGSYENFINANVVYYSPSSHPIYNKTNTTAHNNNDINNFKTSKIILTQCPLFSRPAKFENTINSMKQMIIEQNVSLLIQIAPSINAYNSNNKTLNEIYFEYLINNNCGVFPIEFFQNGSNNNNITDGISNVVFENIDLNKKNDFKQTSYLNVSFTITANIIKFVNGSQRTLFNDNNSIVYNNISLVISKNILPKQLKSIKKFWKLI
jgi:hypothetical protein